MLNNLTNLFNLIKTQMVKTTLESSDLFVVGTRDLRYDGAYKPTIATISAVANAVSPLVPPKGSGLYAQTETSLPITNTTTVGSLIASGVGTLSIPANSFVVGDSFRAKFSGHISSRNNDSLTLIIRTAGVTLATTGSITLPSITNLNWILEVDFTIRAIGGAGTAVIVSSGSFLYMKNASNAFEGDTFSVINNTGFDTTITNSLKVEAQWSAADPLNSISSDLFTLTKTY